ncbi:hypothetical protein LY78DRAFT_708051 [Colletotrichum sublineola]|nr:hypothetical protein LY78DRAFT_708051 [Colletotrichum sublineola]
MTGIAEAQELANAAFSALRVKGVGTSRSFHSWFGASNADPQFVKKLLDQHYMTASSHLRAPTIPPGLNSLLYFCPPLSGLVSDLCGENDMAQVFTFSAPGIPRTGPTLLAVCPAFFNEKVSPNARMVRAFRNNENMESYSKGFYLLHELQHMPKAAYPDPPPIDIENPRGDGMCYKASCCSRLKDDQKIKNAQNFALFALDVTANPERAKPGSSVSSSS